ncbi:MspA family porin [Nocardia sp. 004]|uniref:MspA family porin n=1 Tax=Nocardia sp. 004 TaxID=3385978 RepID=UPI00399F2ACC
MNRRHSHTLAMITAVILAMTGAIAAVDTPAAAAPGEVRSGGLRLIASVDSNTVTPAGGDTATGIPFVHSVKLSGNYSVGLDRTSPLRHGRIVAGYLIGCAVSVADGISIGLIPEVGVEAGFGTDFGLDLVLEEPEIPEKEEKEHDMPWGMMQPHMPWDMMQPHMPWDMMKPHMPWDKPSFGINIGGITLGAGTEFGVVSGLGGQLLMSLDPGSVVAAVISTSVLDRDASFPYTFTHTNTPLNISGCLAPATAMPFVTVLADSVNGSAQTTGYGDQFVF